MFERSGNFLLHFLAAQFKTLPYPTQDYTEKTVIVTGANAGLGLEASRHFVRLGAAKVILGCRSVEKGEAAKADIEKTTERQGVVEVWQVDLSSFESVKEFCRRADKLDRLDAVVENAGVLLPKFSRLEGHEATLTVNVISTFLMALLLLPVLRRSATKHNISPTLVIVSSDVHFQNRFKDRFASATNIFQEMGGDKCDMADQYALSKLMEVFVVRELADKLTAGGKTPVTLDMLHPGWCESDVARNLSRGIRLCLVAANAIFARTAEVGSRNYIFAAAASHTDAHGMYFSDCEPAIVSPFVTSEEGAVAQKRVYGELMEILEKVEPGITLNI